MRRPAGKKKNRLSSYKQEAEAGFLGIAKADYIFTVSVLSASLKDVL